MFHSYCALVLAEVDVGLPLCCPFLVFFEALMFVPFTRTTLILLNHTIISTSISDGGGEVPFPNVLKGRVKDLDLLIHIGSLVIKCHTILNIKVYVVSPQCLRLDREGVLEICRREN